MKENLRKEDLKDYVIVQIAAVAVLLNGIFLIVDSLISILIRHQYRTSIFNTEIYLLIGITLIYLSNLLWRRKYTAWLFSLIVYAVYLIISITELTSHHRFHRSSLFLYRDIVVPLIIVIGLLLARKAFNVRSDIRSFGFSLRIILIVLVITFCYGVAGFQLMDNSDFHHEISMTESIHRTIDQFGLTTSSTLVPYTERARFFLDSLNIISLAAAAYILISLFQPLRARYEDQSENREITLRLLSGSHNNSEDYFKIWPHDKYYYFNKTKTAGVAFTVHRGIALIVGDPFGAVSEFKSLLIHFSELCRINDWLPSLVHTEPHFNPLYSELGFQYQKIGEEAVVETAHFHKNVVGNKYFRNVANRFKKQNYSYEILQPPHSKAVIQRLKEISEDWLTLPGRAERTFMMGSFSDAYMQQCNLVVLRDEASTIQAFLNQVPSFDKEEANFDLMRHSKNSLGNSNDYLLINFIEYARKQGFKRVNLGLCPLVGLDKDDEDRSIIDAALGFLYSNGDRFYSFSGLYKFKQKYEPKWFDRYIVYKNGVRGLTRTLTSLNTAMKPHKFKRK